jgi:hypothetical protein
MLSYFVASSVLLDCVRHRKGKNIDEAGAPLNEKRKT